MKNNILITEEPKLIFIDFGHYVHASIFRHSRSPALPSSYYCLAMLISDLKKVKFIPEDQVYIAVDGGKSWRTLIDRKYKSNRQEKREKYSINWTVEFQEIDKLANCLAKNTVFNVIKIESLEADDIISYGVRQFPNKNKIIISTDSDFEQLFVFPKLKIFSPKKGDYKLPPKDPYKILLKKIKKETADNLIDPVLNEQQFKDRMTIVNLIELPKSIDEKIKPYYNGTIQKENRFYNIPFKSLRKRLEELFKPE